MIKSNLKRQKTQIEDLSSRYSKQKSKIKKQERRFFEELKDDIHSAKVRCADLENEINAMLSSPSRNAKSTHQFRHKAGHFPPQPMIFAVGGDPHTGTHLNIQQYAQQYAYQPQQYHHPPQHQAYSKTNPLFHVEQAMGSTNSK